MGLCLLLGVTGCAKPAGLGSSYALDQRIEIFASSGNGRTAKGFAEDLAVVTDEAAADEALTAESAGVFPLNGGNAVFAQDVFERRNPASTTKVMTALVALKYGNLDDVVTVPQESVITESGSSMAGVGPGDKLTLEQLLYGLLIPSGNDAANAIAVHMGGSIEGFVEMMNEEAARIGATGTHFANANGLTDGDHYMTAYDLYLMFHEALKYEKFRDIIGTKTYTASYKGADESDKTASWSVSNYYMLGKREMPDGLSVFGGKTGTTQAAGYCLIMGETDAGGKEYASVVMHADSRDALYSDMSKIMEKIDRLLKRKNGQDVKVFESSEDFHVLFYVAGTFCFCLKLF